MSVCPVCGNAGAKLAGAKRGLGSASAFAVSCPACPVPFEITARDVSLASSNPKEAAGRRRRWAQMLKEAAHRGDAVMKLY